VKQYRFVFAPTVLLIGFFLLGGCVSHESEYIRRDINTLQKQIDALREDIRNSRISAPATQTAMTVEERKEKADLSAELENVKRDMSNLKAIIEDTQHLTTQTSKRLDDQENRFTTRMNELEAKIEQAVASKEQVRMAASQPAGPEGETEIATGVQKPALPKDEPTAIQTDVERAYQKAYNAFQVGDLDKAQREFLEFLKEYPETPLSDNAQFWIGEIAYKKHEYEAAILAYENVIKKYPKSNKLPDAILKQGLAFLELGDKIDARIILENLVNQYPQTEQAKIARNKLQTLK
jgi:tol-pal system protein YbgF